MTAVPTVSTMLTVISLLIWAAVIVFVRDRIR